MRAYVLALVTAALAAGTSIAYWETHRPIEKDTPQNVRELCFAINLELQVFKGEVDNGLTGDFMRERELVWQGMSRLLDAVDDTCLLPEAHHTCLAVLRWSVREAGFSEHLDSLINAYQTGAPCR